VLPAGTKAAKHKSLYIIVCGYTAAACAIEGDAVQAAAKALGWSTTKVDGQLNVGNAYVAAFAQAIAAKPSAIVAVGPDCATVSNSLKEAKAAGIPTILTLGFDCNDPNNSAVSAPLYTRQLEFLPSAETYGQEELARNKTIADYIIDKTNGQAKIIELYYRYQVLGAYEHDGLHDALADCPGCKVVDEVQYNNDDLAGPALHQMIAAALAQHPEANALFYNFSSTAQLGEIPGAVRAAGRENNMVVAGGEGAAANLEVVAQGNGGLTAEAAYSTQWAGWGVTDELVRLFSGLPAVPEGIGWTMVDATHNLPATGQNWNPTNINFIADYEKSWGV
jgi:ribose transport system substrate-binding protein